MLGFSLSVMRWTVPGKCRLVGHPNLEIRGSDDPPCCRGGVPVTLRPMTAMWGVHALGPQLDFIRARRIALERAGIGDLTALGGHRDALKAALRDAYPKKT